ncbi:hypothetical protein F4776DRAFT_580404 [Hypoxylon sp. NC0597]|nr:hypothetical protein F4776DRAFT_580404 [Hypoxylon sp. NC0597]
MPKSATSPSNFIYQKAQGSSVSSSTPDILTMESTEPSAPGISRPRESLATTHAPWEAIDYILPEPTQGNRRATFPNTQVSNEYQNILQDGVPCCDSYGSTYRPCSACHYQTGTLNVNSAGLPMGTMARHYHSGPTYHPSHLPTTNADPQCVSSTASNGSPQEYFPIPLAQDITSSTDPCSPADIFGIDSRTLSIHSGNPERTQRICTAVHAVHDICLRSTKTFLDSHLVNRRARVSNSPHGIPPDQLKAETSNTRSGININIDNTWNTHTQNIARSPIPLSSNSLLNNISSICTMLWAGSQRDRLDVLNVERAAVENMGRILCWAETVALGDYDEWNMADEEALRQVLEAGRNLCDWLQVPDGIQGMDALENDVTESGFDSL